MSVIYDGKAIIPAPLFSITKQYQTTDDGEKIGSIFDIVMNGTIVAWKGSPKTDGSFHTGSGYPLDEDIPSDERLKAILIKQEALRNLFSDEGLLLEITPLDGSEPIKFNPRISEISFEEGIWFETNRYSVTMQADKLYGVFQDEGEDSFTYNISSASENWTIEFDNRVQNANSNATESSNLFSMTHAVEAIGKRIYNVDGTLAMPAWKQAKNFVLTKIGIETAAKLAELNNHILASGVFDNPGAYTGYNHTKSENLNELTGNYSITESWIVGKLNYIEDYSVSVQTGLETGRTTVSIEGTIEGLETRSAVANMFNSSNVTESDTKWKRAETAFTTVDTELLTRAQTYSGLTLNIQPVSKTVGKNRFTGNVTYNVSYDDRPSQLIANSLSETIVVSDTYAGDVFAEIFVLGRSSGPVLQNLSTYTATQRSLSIECVINTAGSNSLLSGKPSVTSIVNSVRPSATQVFSSPPQETWDSKNGRYSYNVSWIYQ